MTYSNVWTNPFLLHFHRKGSVYDLGTIRSLQIMNFMLLEDLLTIYSIARWRWCPNSEYIFISSFKSYIVGHLYIQWEEPKKGKFCSYKFLKLQWRNQGEKSIQKQENWQTRKPSEYSLLTSLESIKLISRDPQMVELWDSSYFYMWSAWAFPMRKLILFHLDEYHSVISLICQFLNCLSTGLFNKWIPYCISIADWIHSKPTKSKHNKPTSWNTML